MLTQALETEEESEQTELKIQLDRIDAALRKVQKDIDEVEVKSREYDAPGEEELSLMKLLSFVRSKFDRATQMFVADLESTEKKLEEVNRFIVKCVEDTKALINSQMKLKPGELEYNELDKEIKMGKESKATLVLQRKELQARAAMLQKLVSDGWATPSNDTHAKAHYSSIWEQFRNSSDGEEKLSIEVEDELRILNLLSQLYKSWMLTIAMYDDMNTDEKALWSQARSRLEKGCSDEVDNLFFLWLTKLKFFVKSNFSAFYDETSREERENRNSGKAIAWKVVSTYHILREVCPLEEKLYNLYLTWCLRNV